MEGERQHAEGTAGPVFAAPDAIELRHLRAFMAVAGELNFARAAARLYRSPPALSRQVRALERLVGCDLFHRNTHRVELTLAGEALLDRASRVLAELDEGVRRARELGDELGSRMARLWQPTSARSTDVDLQDMRNAYEELHCRFAVPPEVQVRSVSAGVPALELSVELGRPADLLYLHGGGHVMGSAFGYRPLAGAIAAAGPATVLLPEYRLAPEYPYPASLDDVSRAYRWMLDRGVAAERVTVCGDSSGAGLVMSLLLDLKARGLPLPGGAVLLCPFVDLTVGNVRNPAGNAPSAMPADLLRSFAASYLDGHPPDDPIVAPLKADLTGLPPLLVQAAAGDPILDDARGLADHARRQGVDVSFELYAVDTHAFHIFWSFVPEAADAVRKAGAFAARTSASAGRREAAS